MEQVCNCCCCCDCDCCCCCCCRMPDAICNTQYAIRRRKQNATNTPKCFSWCSAAKYADRNLAVVRWRILQIVLTLPELDRSWTEVLRIFFYADNNNAHQNAQQQQQQQQQQVVVVVSNGTTTVRTVLISCIAFWRWSLMANSRCKNTTFLCWASCSRWACFRRRSN